MRESKFLQHHKAAKQGLATAQANLGTMIMNGQGVQSDYAKALQWLRLAADQGYVDADANLGVMYQNGLGRFCEPHRSDRTLPEGPRYGKRIRQAVPAEFGHPAVTPRQLMDCR